MKEISLGVGAVKDLRPVEERKGEIVEAIKRATPEQVGKLLALFGIKVEA